MSPRAVSPYWMENYSSVYKAVAASQRRTVCQYLAATDDPPVTLEEVASHVVSAQQPSHVDQTRYRRVRTGLHHTHLPKLADAGILQYDDTQQLVWGDSALPVAIELIQVGQNLSADISSHG